MILASNNQLSPAVYPAKAKMMSEEPVMKTTTPAAPAVEAEAPKVVTQDHGEVSVVGMDSAMEPALRRSVRVRMAPDRYGVTKDYL